MQEDLVTGGEFGRWRADFTKFQERLETRLNDGFGGMNDRLDELNGRTRKNSEAIVVLDERVSSIKVAGCGQLAAHRAILETPPLPPNRGWQDWHPAAKIGAAGGGVALLATMTELLSRVLRYFGV